ncbi:hypothetical protein DPMN_184364 [Dreissena polymorpha]|uniref:Uncharacterized protein n=1 Tax=Dreissena polymorpha TaxID=45954 RepID=A0A9D4DID7_DREPO|nr:hypothetical protein DPMN_184364 [Dreissena polymorpha]
MLHSPQLDEDQVECTGDHDDRRGDLVPGEWRRGRNLEDARIVNTRGLNTAIKKGKIVRNTLKHWVNSPAGWVP